MTTTLAPPSRATNNDIDRSLDALSKGHNRLAQASPAELVRLAEECIEGTMRTARDWVDTACRYKGVAAASPLRAEDIMAGPVATIRQLRLVIQSLQDIASTGQPRLPGRPKTGTDGRVRVPVFPARGMFDSITFQGFKVDAWLKPGIGEESVRLCPDGYPGRWKSGNPRICLVLGAGNVSSIPTTDAFTKLFQEGRTVLLKMNPVNESLGPIFERAYKPLIDAGYLRIIYGGADVGAAAVAHELVDEVHITGSIYSHDAIVWGPPGPERDRRKRDNEPILRKPITSELGNVTPWIIVPGKYSERQLDFQAENVATSITNNCSFNCIATKVIVTSANWPDRDRFLDKVARVLGRIAPRKAYYPGAAERFTRFSGQSVPAGGETLPWTLLRSISPKESPLFFKEESFVCVSVETPLEADSDTAFLDRAVDFANNELWGTLAASITLPVRFPQGFEPRTGVAIGPWSTPVRHDRDQPVVGARFCHDVARVGGRGRQQPERRSKRHRLGAQHVDSRRHRKERAHRAAHRLSEADVVCDPLESRSGRLAVIGSVPQTVGLEARRPLSLGGAARSLMRQAVGTTGGACGGGNLA